MELHTPAYYQWWQRPRNTAYVTSIACHSYWLTIEVTSHYNGITDNVMYMDYYCRFNVTVV